MTRINSAIEVKKLTDEHLLAEHREIIRLISYLNKSIHCGSINKIPKDFRLGNGHVLFFLNKMKFIYNRYKKLYNECIKRKFNVTDYSNSFIQLFNSKYFNDYIPTQNEYILLVDRITNNILKSKKECFHYCSKKISKNDAIRKLKE